MPRRDFFQKLGTGYLGGAMAVALGTGTGCSSMSPATRPITLTTRGVVIYPEDLSLDWPERAARARLSTVALHHYASPGVVMRFIRSEAGQVFLEKCQRLGLEVEYELHAMKELLPREMFAKNPELFRVNEKGERSADSNCCVHSQAALEVIGQNARNVAAVLRPTTGRYFFWGEDGRPWCRCNQCRSYSDADQALILENSLLRNLKQMDPRAQLAHLAYHNTLRPPTQVKPDPGIFLEYAPIKRTYDIPYAQQAGPNSVDGLTMLDANLEVFPRASAQALEYWLDVSRVSHWNRPAVKLPWNREVFLADVDTYTSRGMRHITTFAAWIDADYAKRFADLQFIDEYGAGLQRSA
jgi:hypothetical protein